MITALVKYEQSVDGVRPDLDTVEIRSMVVEVTNLVDLNDLFRKIIDIKILSNQ